MCRAEPRCVALSRAEPRHELGPGASRRDATRTDSSCRVVVTSRLVAPTEFDSRLTGSARGSELVPKRPRAAQIVQFNSTGTCIHRSITYTFPRRGLVFDTVLVVIVTAAARQAVVVI